MPRTSSPTTIDDYIRAAAPAARPVLREIRRVVRAAVPDATETISYRMPAFRARRVFFFFAAFKEHIGIYPPLKTDAKLAKELRPFANEKGNLRFPQQVDKDLDAAAGMADGEERQVHAPNRQARVSALPLCAAIWSVLSLLISYCGSSSEAWCVCPL